MASEMMGKFKMMFFQYQFMTLMFIYLSKRGGDGYWRGAPDGMNMVDMVVSGSGGGGGQFFGRVCLFPFFFG